MKIIILNGPPNSGKGAIANAVCSRSSMRHMEFKEALRLDVVHCMDWFEYDLDSYKRDSYGSFEKWFRMASEDHELKELPSPRLRLQNKYFDAWRDLPEGKLKDILTPHTLLINEVYLGQAFSPRQALMFTSEVIMKPLFGVDFYGASAGRAVVSLNPLHEEFIFSDGGFVEELMGLAKTVPEAEILIVHLSRDGCTFEGDSRYYITQEMLEQAGVDTSKIRFYALHNEEGKLEETVGKLLEVFSE